MELINQPFTGQLGNRLFKLLDEQDYHTLNIVVAFAKNSGVLRIKDALEKFRKRGGIVNVYVGVDLDGTSYEALSTLRLHTDSLNVVHFERGQTFHAKIYQFIGKDKGLVIVGSHNLTGGGLWTNVESSILIPMGGPSANIGKGLNKYLRKLESLEDSFMSIGAQADIDRLLQHRYITKEVTDQVHRANAAKQNGNGERLFGDGTQASIPRVRIPKKEKTAEASVAPAGHHSLFLSDNDQTIWFETRKMTGGSRNILDLSKKSLIEHKAIADPHFEPNDNKFMRGAVEFFGLNPDDTNKSKTITINFDGIDYTGNEIVFPKGAKANGTWRLQIKGVDSSKKKITNAFAAKAETIEEDHYLANKLISFTKIQDDYYFMSVFPVAELDKFREASRIVARNGPTKTAKLLGLL